MFQFYKEMVKEVFLLCFIIHSRFFVPSCLSYKQFLKNTCQPYKTWYRKAYATATGFRSLQKKVMTHLLKEIFLHHKKDQTKNFSPCSYERPFDHWKEFQGPGFAESRFFWVRVFQGPSFSGSRSRVWVQVLEVAIILAMQNFIFMKIIILTDVPIFQ